MLRSVLVAVPLLFAVQCSAAASPAVSPAATAQATEQSVEIGWTDGDKSTTRLSLALPLDKSCSSVELERDKRSTRLQVCRISPDGEAALLQFDVERLDASGTQKRSMKLHATARLRSGAKVLIGRFEPGDATTELVATLH